LGGRQCRERLERKAGEKGWRERLERTAGENGWRERLERKAAEEGNWSVAFVGRRKGAGKYPLAKVLKLCVIACPAHLHIPGKNGARHLNMSQVLSALFAKPEPEI